MSLPENRRITFRYLSITEPIAGFFECGPFDIIINNGEIEVLPNTYTGKPLLPWKERHDLLDISLQDVLENLVPEEEFMIYKTNKVKVGLPWTHWTLRLGPEGSEDLLRKIGEEKIKSF